MNELKSRQGEGYDFYDYDALVFPAAGAPFIEAAYVVGTNQNAAIQGAWPNEGGWTGSLLTANVAPGAFIVPVADITGFPAVPLAVPLLVILIDPVTGLSETALAVAITATPPAPTGFLTIAPFPVVNNYLVANAATVHPYLPVDAQNTLYFASVAVNIRLINRALVAQQLLGVLPAGVPGQIVIPATTWFTLPDKWFTIQAIAVGALPGVLIIKASG